VTKVRRVATTTLAAGAILALGVAPASATITRYTAGGTQISLESDDAADSITIECVGGQARQGGVNLLPCADVEELFARGQGGNDTIDYSSVTSEQYPQLRRVEIDGGADIDTIHGSQLGDTVEDAYGDTVHGNGGNDLISGAATATGGAGDDVLTGIQGSVDGGTGTDRIEQPSNGPVLGGLGEDTLAIDFFSNAGGLAADVTFVITNDNLHLAITAPTSVEANVSTSSLERYELDLLDAGTQTADFTAFSGAIDINGHGGTDIVRAGAGEDFVDGGAGDDQLTGGAGFDYLTGGPGNDTIDVRDGGVDRVRCGEGTDTVVADPVDVLEACENVQLPAPETGAITGPKKVKAGVKASYTFSSPTPGATFQCQLDGKGAWKSCASPYTLRTKKLKPGKHTLRVRAVTSTPDASPSSLKVKVTGKVKSQK
jgi:Ca2+-binding RTX toxin-like protein